MGNILLFIPYGFLSSYYLDNKKFGVITILTIITTLTIETVQYYIGRVFDIDDIILNLFEIMKQTMNCNNYCMNIIKKMYLDKDNSNLENDIDEVIANKHMCMANLQKIKKEIKTGLHPPLKHDIIII